MDPTVVSTAIGVGGTLIGAALGGLASYFSTARMLTKQAEKERADERRAHERDALRECEALCVAMAADMEHARHPANRRYDDAEDEREERVLDNYRKFRATALYLPGHVRSRIEELGEILGDADKIAYHDGHYGDTHYHRPYGICLNVRDEVRRVVAAALREEQIPERPKIIREYVAALHDLNRQRDEYFSNDPNPMRQEQYERDRADFCRRHPEFAPEDDS